MDTLWQLPWILGRLAPRWIVEHLAGKRDACVRLAFVDAQPDQIERVRKALALRLGAAWHVQTIALSTRDSAVAPRESADLVWALGGPGKKAREDRAELASTLGAWLAPGGWLIGVPMDVDASGSELQPCSAPGVFVKVARDDRDFGALASGRG
jgi:hypothetical protein